MHINNPFVVSPIICLGASKASHTKERKIRITCLISINKLNIMRFDIEISFTRLSINNSRPLCRTKTEFDSQKDLFSEEFFIFIKSHKRSEIEQSIITMQVVPGNLQMRVKRRRKRADEKKSLTFSSFNVKNLFVIALFSNILIKTFITFYGFCFNP